MNDRQRKIAELKRYFANKLAEDRLDGTGFDCQVLKELEAMEAKWADPKPVPSRPTIFDAPPDIKEFAKKELGLQDHCVAAAFNALAEEMTKGKRLEGYNDAIDLLTRRIDTNKRNALVSTTKILGGSVSAVVCVIDTIISDPALIKFINAAAVAYGERKFLQVNSKEH